jgi:hypothetical protein
MAATENSSRGNGYDLNDGGSPMDNGGHGKLAVLQKRFVPWNPAKQFEPSK